MLASEIANPRFTPQDMTDIAGIPNLIRYGKTTNEWRPGSSKLLRTKLLVDQQTTSDTKGEMTSDISEKDLGTLPMETSTS